MCVYVRARTRTHTIARSFILARSEFVALDECHYLQSDEEQTESLHRCWPLFVCSHSAVDWLEIELPPGDAGGNKKKESMMHTHTHMPVYLKSSLNLCSYISYKARSLTHKCCVLLVFPFHGSISFS